MNKTPDPNGNTLFSGGKVVWIGLSPRSRGEIRVVPEAMLLPGQGLRDDHHAKRRASHRQVTLIQAEDLPRIAAAMGCAEVCPTLLRRNLVVSGIDLSLLMHERFQVGETILEGTGPCDPCQRMEENLGPGGRAAMENRGGITARVVVGGNVHLGDGVQRCAPNHRAGFGSTQVESRGSAVV